MVFKRKTYEEIEATGYTTSSGCFKIESDGNRFSVVPRRIVDWRVVVAVGCAILFSLCARYIEPDEATGDASFEVMYIIPAIATFIAIIILFAHVKGQRDEVRLGPVLHVDFSKQLVHLPRINVKVPAADVVRLEHVEMRFPANAASEFQWDIRHFIRLVTQSHDQEEVWYPLTSEPWFAKSLSKAISSATGWPLKHVFLEGLKRGSLSDA
ncbi:MAG: hypothetical protein U0640_02725 [Phycisphaerales bacterium]